MKTEDNQTIDNATDNQKIHYVISKLVAIKQKSQALTIFSYADSAKLKAQDKPNLTASGTSRPNASAKPPLTNIDKLLLHLEHSIVLLFSPEWFSH